MRIVIKVKVGTNILADEAGVVHALQIELVAKQIIVAKKSGDEIILVSSGAIGMGKALLPKLESPAKKQIWAAIGQAELMKVYADYFRSNGVTAGQCLLVRDDFSNRERYENSVRTIEGLLSADCLPVINENDVVVMEDLTFGDNDVLAAMVAIALKTDRLIILTNQTGLYTTNPAIDPGARLVTLVENVEQKFEEMCVAGMSSLGRGGMISKVRAAKHAIQAGIETFIGDGRNPNILKEIASGAGQYTRFIARSLGDLDRQKRWLLSAKGFGQLLIDDGATQALYSGKSLLLPGILSARGIFDKYEIVEIVTRNGQTVAYGKVNFESRDIQQAVTIRKRSGQNPETIEKEIVHRNYMLVLKI